MLELAVIKTTPKSTETPAGNSKKPVSRTNEEENTKEFQSEYEAAAQGTGKTDEIVDETEKVNSSDSKPLETALSDEDPKPTSEVDTDFSDDLAIGEIASDTDEENVAPVRIGSKEKADLPVASDMKPAALNPDDTSKKSVDVASKPELKVSKHPDASKASKPEKAVAPQKSEGHNKSTAETIFLSKAAENAQSQGRTKVNVDVARNATDAAVLPTQHAQNKASTNARLEIKSEKFVSAKLKKAEVMEAAISRRNYSGSEGRTAPPPNVPDARIQTAAAVPVQAQTKIGINKDKPEFLSIARTEADSFAPWDSRPSTSQSAASTLNQILNRADTPAMIARQMAEALQKLPDRPVEISLNPKELGRVRMNISSVEAGITVSVIADRPETLDLMRRNIDQLTREFQSIGYENINFAFSEGEAQQNFKDEQNDSSVETSSLLDLTSDDELQVTPSNATVGSGVDIRL